jgi:hypothetical protein
MNHQDTQFETVSQAACYLWDYFYMSHYPTDSERRAWSRIECATIRIRESEQLLGDRYPACVRVKHAKRVRRAVREIVRLSTEALERVPDEPVAYALGMLEGCAQRVIDEQSDEARAQPLH